MIKLKFILISLKSKQFQFVTWTAVRCKDIGHKDGIQKQNNVTNKGNKKTYLLSASLPPLHWIGLFFNSGKMPGTAVTVGVIDCSQENKFCYLRDRYEFWLFLLPSNNLEWMIILQHDRENWILDVIWMLNMFVLVDCR